MDVVIGCLDNREARLAVNRFCYWVNKPWVDGAIQELLGLVRVFVPGQGACYECTLTEQALRDLSVALFLPVACPPEHPAGQGADDADDCVHHRRHAVAGSAQIDQ